MLNYRPDQHPKMKPETCPPNIISQKYVEIDL